MFASIAQFWFWPEAQTRVEARPAPRKPHRAPLFIGDVVMPRSGSTEFYHQWKRAEEDLQGSDEDTPPQP